MNSLFGNFGNSILNLTKAAQTPAIPQSQPQMPSILMQAFGAAMRGESPQAFMQQLASQHPQLRQYDFSNLQATAQQVCQEKGVDMQEAINSIDNIANSIM